MQYEKLDETEKPEATASSITTIFLDLFKIDDRSELLSYLIDADKLTSVHLSLAHRQLRLMPSRDWRAPFGFSILAVANKTNAEFCSDALLRLTAIVIERPSKLDYLLLAYVYSILGKGELVKRYRDLAASQKCRSDIELCDQLEALLQDNNIQVELDLECNSLSELLNELEKIEHRFYQHFDHVQVSQIINALLRHLHGCLTTFDLIKKKYLRKVAKILKNLLPIIGDVTLIEHGSVTAVCLKAIEVASNVNRASIFHKLFKTLIELCGSLNRTQLVVDYDVLKPYKLPPDCPIEVAMLMLCLTDERDFEKLML